MKVPTSTPFKGPARDSVVFFHKPKKPITVTPTEVDCHVLEVAYPPMLKRRVKFISSPRPSRNSFVPGSSSAS